MKFTYDLFDTDWGCVAAVWSDKGLWELTFPRPTAEAALQDVAAVHPAETERYDLSAGQLKVELNLYLRGFAVPFSIPVDWRGYTAFQAAILKCTAAIPYGQTLSYQAVAELAGSPKAARAAGGALNGNRTPIVVPCHRVIGADGSLTGFGGGLDMKKALLLLEKNVATDLSGAL